MKLVWRTKLAVILFASLAISASAEIKDGGFEVWRSSSDLTYWNEEDNLPSNLRQETGIVYSEQSSVALGRCDFIRQSFQITEGAHAFTVMAYPAVQGACQATMEIYDVHGKYLTSATVWSTGTNAWEMLNLSPAFPQGATSMRLILTNHANALAYFDELRIDGAASVALTSFNATVVNSGKAIELRWQTACETQNFGFYIYRSTTIDGNFKRLNDTIITGAGTTGHANEYIYTDTQAQKGAGYFYSLADVSFSGQITHHKPIWVNLASTPDACRLSQCYPNPFNPETTIPFETAGTGNVSLKIYDLKGQLIKILLDEIKEPGSHTVIWNGTDAQGHPAASGAYIYVIEAGGFKTGRRMVLLR